MGAAGLAACAMLPAPDDPAAKPVSVNNQTYFIHQLTASTWTASTRATVSPMAGDSNKAALLQAIEKMSGCKVTDSDYSSSNRQLDAQVDCGSRLNN